MANLYESVVEDDFEELEKEIALRREKHQEKIERIRKEDLYLKNKYSFHFNTSFKNRIKERDRNECYLCKSKNDLTVHHISYLRAKTHEKFVVTLCRGCNGRVNKKSERKQWEEFFTNQMHYVISRQENGNRTKIK